MIEDEDNVPGGRERKTGGLQHSDGHLSAEKLVEAKRQILSELLRSEALRSGDRVAAIRHAMEASARILDTERSSVWQFGADRSRLECADMYILKSEVHEQGAVIESSTAPSYFAALWEERSIAADDARTDPRTCEFRDGYLIPNGITSMLDAPILLRGELIGVVCHEHVGEPRRWQPWEELIAATVADFVSMAFSASEQVAQNQELERYRSHLEALVEERTTRLRESEESLRSLFEASPVALVLSRRSDQTVLEANLRAADMFGVPIESVRGLRAPDFWEDHAERDALLRELSQDGDVPKLVARLRAAGGRPFWGEVTAQSITYRGERAVLVGVRDVSDQKAAEESLRRSRETLKILFDAAPLPMVLTTLEGGVIRLCNERAADMFETTVSGMIGREAPSFYVDAGARAGFLQALRETGRVDGFETRLRTVAGREFWALLTAKIIHVEDEAAFMVGFADLTAQKHNEEQLRRLAATDPLTGIHNRRRLLELAENEVERAERYGNSLALAMLDADFFKSINDRFGHDVGDETLRAIVQLAEDEIRRTDFFGRYGGEEFVLIFPETSAMAARGVLERIRRAVAAHELTTESGTVTITISCGVVERRPAEDLESLLKRADQALYEAKTRGRNRIVLGE